MPRPLRILFVCAGNTCRSPMAAAIMRAALEDRTGQRHVPVDSAGTECRNPGRGADPRALAALGAHAIEGRDHRQRQLTAADFERFDLILAMDRRIAQHARRLAPPGAAGKVRLLLDFAPETGISEIPDPWEGGPAEYARALDLISQGVRGLVAALESGSAQAWSSS